LQERPLQWQLSGATSLDSKVPDRFTERLRKTVTPIWEAQQTHPFVCGIAEGDLDLDRFKCWLRQDYVFLMEYVRLLGLAVARSRDLRAASKLSGLLHETVNTEMALHRAYAAEFGISNVELESEEAAPTTRAYSDFLLRIAATGDYAELIAGLLPCMWGYSEIGQRLAQRPLHAGNRYKNWIAMYSSAEFADWARWCRDLMDEVAAGLPESQLRKLEQIFVTSSRYEWKFWEMAWNQERWPV
jgi:thiaminase/transcriptional activator TenA